MFLAGPQPRWCEFSAPCRTSTAIVWVQCSVPDLNRDRVGSVFRAEPQPRSCEEICQKECQKECQIYGRFMLPCLIPVYSYMFDRCSPDMSSGQEMKSVLMSKKNVACFNVLKWHGGDCSKWSNLTWFLQADSCWKRLRFIFQLIFWEFLERWKLYAQDSEARALTIS